MRITLTSFLLLFVTSCSIQSNQYNMITSLLTDKENIASPKKNWSLLHENRVIDLYAINYEDQIIFADENINIFYKDNQIYKVNGLYPDAESIEIKQKNNSLEYIINNKNLSTDFCDSMILSDKKKLQSYTKKCYHGSSKRTYLNQITLNSDRLIIGLRFKVRPNYPPVELKIKQNINYN